MNIITSEDVRHIALLMDQGMRSGIFDREGYRISWDFNYDKLTIDIFKN